MSSHEVFETAQKTFRKTEYRETTASEARLEICTRPLVFMSTLSEQNALREKNGKSKVQLTPFGIHYVKAISAPRPGQAAN